MTEQEPNRARDEAVAAKTCQIRAAAVSCVLPDSWPDTHRIVPSGGR